MVPQNSNRFVVVSGGHLERLYCKLEADFCSLSASRDQVCASARNILKNECIIRLEMGECSCMVL